MNPKKQVYGEGSGLGFCPVQGEGNQAEAGQWGGVVAGRRGPHAFPLGARRGHMKGQWGWRTVPQVAQPHIKTSLSQARPSHQQRGADTTVHSRNHPGGTEPLHPSLALACLLLSETLGISPQVRKPCF